MKVLITGITGQDGSYLAENSSYVSSSWPEKHLTVVVKLARPTGRATGVCTRVRGNWEEVFGRIAEELRKMNGSRAQDS